MRVLVVLKNSPAQRYLIKLCTKTLIEDVRRLINQKKHSKALATVFLKGRLERKVEHGESSAADADVILSKDAVSWDLTK